MLTRKQEVFKFGQEKIKLWVFYDDFGNLVDSERTCMGCSRHRKCQAYEMWWACEFWRTLYGNEDL